MTSERKNITQPADWWASFEAEAKDQGITLSEWVGEACKQALPKSFRNQLSQREMSDLAVVPRTDQMLGDFDCPWVVTYRDKGPVSPSPGGGFPSAGALYFPSEEAARQFLEQKRIRGREAVVDLLPLRQPGNETNAK